ncbi:MAG: penicillin-binding protein 2 [Planctomycetota bacterium]
MFERRLQTLLLGLGVAFLVLVGRFFYLQIIRGDHYLSVVRENRRQIEHFKSQRGRILDRNGAVLARNRQTRDIAVVMSRITEPAGGQLEYSRPLARRLVRNLNSVLGIGEHLVWARLDEVFRTIARDYKGATRHDPIVIFPDVGDAVVGAIEFNRFEGRGTVGGTVLEDRFPGVEITTSQVRTYPYGREVCHIVGYTGLMSDEDRMVFHRDDIGPADQVGKAGIERSYEEKLHGLAGQRMVDKFIRDNKIVYEVIKVEMPEPGENCILTLDIRLQRIVLEELDAFQARSSFPVRGACVFVDPRNGEVLAMVSYPVFDLNWFIPRVDPALYGQIVADPSLPLLNRAVCAYPPGSTFKPVVCVAATAEHIAIDNVLCVGSKTIGRSTFRCWRSYGHGEIDLVGALRESCNVYFYELGRAVGIENIHKYAGLLGFGESTGIDLFRPPGRDGAGSNPSREYKRSHNLGPWTLGDTFNTSIGQGLVGASPLQVALMVGLVGTQGRRVVPHLWMGRTAAPELFRDRVLTPAAFEAAREGMYEVIHDAKGTARSAFHALTAMGVDSSGKTGSAEVAKGRKTHSWYCGYCPSDAPVMGYSMVVENAGHGSEAAVPIMAAIMNRIYKDDKLRFELGLPAPQAPGSRTETDADGETAVPAPDIIPEEGVPAAESTDEIPLMIITE